MNGAFSETIFGIPWIALAGVAAAVAIAFVVIDTGAGSVGWRWLVLRWAHPLCWVFLSTAALVRSRATPVLADWAGSLAAVGGVLYLAFVVTWLVRPRG